MSALLDFVVLMHCRQPHKLFHWNFADFFTKNIQLANYFSVENNIQITSLVEGAGSSCFRKLIETRGCAEKKSIYNINKCYRSTLDTVV
jgi:hypothetical protein